MSAISSAACVNTGCTPTKAMVASAYAARIARGAAEYGVVIGGDVGIDMRRVKARKDAIFAASRNGRTLALENAANITLYRGHARFASPQVVQIPGERLRAVGGRDDSATTLGFATCELRCLGIVCRTEHGKSCTVRDFMPFTEEEPVNPGRRDRFADQQRP